MSSILKALKKLEEEKASRTAGPLGRSGGQYVAPAVNRRPPWLLLICGIGVGLLLAGGIYVLLDNPPDTAPAKPVATAPAPAPAAAVAVSKPAAVPPAAPAVRPAAPRATAVNAGAEPDVRPPPAEKPVAARSVAQAPASVKSKDLEAPVKKGDVAATVEAEPPVVTIAQAPAPPPVARQPGAASAVASQGAVDVVQVDRRDIPSPGQQWAAPGLVVSDILPVSDQDRMAIVNDLPVMEGTVVENAVVKEIYSDRVLFVIDGRSVEVPLTPAR